MTVVEQLNVDKQSFAVEYDLQMEVEFRKTKVILEAEMAEFDCSTSVDRSTSVDGSTLVKFDTNGVSLGGPTICTIAQL